MDDTILSVLVFGFVITLVIGIHFARSIDDKNAIRRHIQQIGGKNVQITEVLMDGDRSNHTYTVIFSDKTNQTYQTQCKRRDQLPISSIKERFYWTTSPTALLAGLSEESGYTNHQQDSQIFPRYEDEPELDLRSDKGKLVDSLTSSYKFERKFAAENAAKMKQVNESIIQLLQEMAQSDPDEEVQAAAREALRSLDRDKIII